jgi:hypothetical protein
MAHSQGISVKLMPIVERIVIPLTATAIATPVVTVLPRSRGGLGGAHGGGSPRPAPVVEAEIVSEPAHASLAAISTATGFFRAPTRVLPFPFMAPTPASARR